jgi:SGT1 protein
VHLALQAAGRMTRFPPEDMVTALVTFNRTLYAQLKQQEFQVHSYLLTSAGVAWSGHAV